MFDFYLDKVPTYTEMTSKNKKLATDVIEFNSTLMNSTLEIFKKYYDPMFTIYIQNVQRLMEDYYQNAKKNFEENTGKK